MMMLQKYVMEALEVLLQNNKKRNLNVKKRNIGKKEIFLLYVLLFFCYNILRIKIFGKV